MIPGSQFVPSQMFFTTGAGVHREKLISFEMALRDAGIAHHNLVRVSSIFPPGCAIVEPGVGAENLAAGQIVFCVLSEAMTDEPNRRVFASLGLAVPADRSKYGFISEHHGFGQRERMAGDHAEDLAASMLATVVGMSGHGVSTQNHTIVAEAPENGDWVTVMSVAVFCG